jgi:hypothetical protein
MADGTNNSIYLSTAAAIVDDWLCVYVAATVTVTVTVSTHQETFSLCIN